MNSAPLSRAQVFRHRSLAREWPAGAGEFDEGDEGMRTPEGCVLFLCEPSAAASGSAHYQSCCWMASFIARVSAWGPPRSRREGVPWDRDASDQHSKSSVSSPSSSTNRPSSRNVECKRSPPCHGVGFWSSSLGASGSGAPAVKAASIVITAPPDSATPYAVMPCSRAP